MGQRACILASIYQRAKADGATLTRATTKLPPHGLWQQQEQQQQQSEGTWHCSASLTMAYHRTYEYLLFRIAAMMAAGSWLKAPVWDKCV
ncbi:hypothetical protein ACLKA6_019688 [Drosophila palustris]